MDFTLPVSFGILSGLSILLGGTIANAMARRRVMLLSLSSGAILGIALVALLPEAVELSSGFWPEGTVFLIAALGYAGYFMLDRFVEKTGGGVSRHIGPASLFIHAMVDGLMAGIGFSFSLKAGLIMAGAAMIHGVAHGINTVSLVAARNGSHVLARHWLRANAVAPVLGSLCATVIALSQPAMAALVAIFAGVFLFIATSELMPSAIWRKPMAGGLVVGAILVIALARMTLGAH